eukprot:TRINITY_DN81719_c0_g1_i1.p1 TRINITY_DN81719_c0_g1~~TRINITY_DN81719_c0_g1_i1.p1  ORF type:complete len:180 (-),score=43.91 TRINITY_DN81719_c0_g1_i1:282-821(-)
MSTRVESPHRPGFSGQPIGSASSSSSVASAGQSTVKRLQSELMQLMMNAAPGVSAFPSGEDLYRWSATITGSAGTVYEGLSYKLNMEFPVRYPLDPPTVRFETPCFHPNVDQFGNICLDILKDEWSPVYSVRTILLSLQSLLADPNVDSPLNGYAADLWKDQKSYETVLRLKYRNKLAI